MHGLCLSDRDWFQQGKPDLGETLRENPGLSPVYLRYNTGRHIDYEPNKSINGPPIANLFLTMMAAMSVNRASFGDNSTGLLGQLG